MTEAQGDESLRLKKIAEAKGWNLAYSRKMTGPEVEDDINLSIDERMARMTQMFAARIPTDTVKAKLFEGDDGAPFFFWLSSESDVATVLQEITDYLESPNPDDPGIQRAKSVRDRYKDVEMVGVNPEGRRIWIVSSDEPLEG